MTAATDRKLRMDPELEGVSKDWGLVTPSDTEDLAEVARYLCFLTAGDVKVKKVDGTDEILPVIAGMYLMGMVTRVYATGTHASPKIIAFY